MSRRARTSRLNVEALEDRAVPSTFTVLTLADSGAGSLRQAIFEANALPGSDTIDFADGLSGPIVLSSGQLSVTDDLIIDGPGVNQLAVSGNDTSRVFQIAGGISVAVDDLTIADGRADRGGAIRNAGGRLTLTNVVVTNNRAIGLAGAETWGG